jgi:hypothetical protein
MGATSSLASREAHLKHDASRRHRGRPSLKLALLSVVLVGLGTIIGFSISRETARPTAAPSGAQPLRVASRPALKPDEQAYVEALWPIHTQLEVAAERVALGTIFYKSDDLDRAGLKARLEEALSNYRSAGEKLLALRPPASMQKSHDGYVAAVSLFRDSTAEMLKMFDDGSDDHLLVAYPGYLDGTNKIRDLGGTFWPDEFPPN